MKSYVFRVELEEEEGTWTATVPALPGCAAEGSSINGALEAVHELAKAYVEVLIEDGRPIPLEEIVSGMEGPAVAIVA